MRLRALSAALNLLIALPAASLAGVTAWLPLEIREGAIYFDAEVKGVPVKALFATGTNQHAVSKALVEKLGLGLSGKRYETRGREGIEYDTRSVGELPVKLFGVDFKLRDVPADSAVDLVIGAGFLQSFVVQIDYPNSRMRLLTQDAVDMEKVGNLRLAHEWEFGVPALQVTFVGGKKSWLTLDTAHIGPMLVRRLFAENQGWLEVYKQKSDEESDLLVLPSVTVGPFELEDVPVSVPAPGVQQNVGGFRESGAAGNTRIRRVIRVDGVLGYELLRHFVVTLDYDRERAHIAVPAEEPAAASTESASSAAAGSEPEAAQQ
jgi:hypothetical protein